MLAKPAFQFQSLPNCDAMGKFNANGRTRVVKNQFSAEEHMNKYQEFIKQFCTKVLLGIWKSTVCGT